MTSSRETNHLSIRGRTIPLRVRENARARRYILRVDPLRPLITVTRPRWGSERKALRFAQSNEAWIADQLAKGLRPVPFMPGEIIPLRGEDHRIVHRAGRGLPVDLAEPAADGLPEIAVTGARDFVGRRVGDWLKREARRDLDACVAIHAEALGVRPARLSVKDTASRWGSCSTSGVLSFSWRLILAPPFVLDYVAAHETAHLLEMNHGPRFWRLVRAQCPETRAAETWLSRHGPGLHRYQAAAKETAD